MARKKSVNDLQAQASRLFNYRTYTTSRSNRVEAAYRRYRNNIQSSLGYSNRGIGIGVANIANMRFSNPRYQSIREINAARVSRRVYMGLSNG
jgi:hypothetical protein